MWQRCCPALAPPPYCLIPADVPFFVSALRGCRSAGFCSSLADDINPPCPTDVISPGHVADKERTVALKQLKPTVQS